MNHAPATPFLALDLDAFERNVERLVDAIVRRGGKRWRPHVKAIRSPALARRLIAAGAQGVTCATASEAQAMVLGGIDDVLVASQLVQAEDLRSVAALNRRAQVAAAIDCAAHAELLARAAEAEGARVPVLIEVEVGLGRAGVAPGAAVVALARAVQARPALRFAGLMAWEGHATRIADAAARRAAVTAAVGLLTASARQCAEAGLPAGIVSCGGTGTFEVTSTLDGVTELQAGGGVFGDLRYREDFGIALDGALCLWATVVARPTPRRIVCDAGFKSLAVYPKAPRPLGLAGVESLAHAAEHLSIGLKQDAAAPAVGERIAFEIGYADATTFLHRELLGFRGEQKPIRFELHARR
jgi:D-serine deaminase-like pyridoxal phosphate-dependent protein